MKKLVFAVIISLSLCSLQGEIAFKPEKAGVYAQITTNKGTFVVEFFADLAPKTVANFTGLAEGTREWTDPATGKKQKKPFYNNLSFHRVIKDFMIQGGCPLGNGTGGPGYQFEDECYGKGAEVKGTIKDEETAILIWQQLIVPYAQQFNGEVTDMELKKLIDDVVALQSGQPLFGKTIAYFQEKTAFKEPVYKQTLLHGVDYGTLCMANSGTNTNGSQFFIVTNKEGCSWLNGKHTVFGKVIQGMETVHAIESVQTDASDKPKARVFIKEIKIIRK